MGWRNEQEAQLTVACKYCNTQYTDPGRRPRQKWLVGMCPFCGQINRPNATPNSSFQYKCLTEAKAGS